MPEPISGNRPLLVRPGRVAPSEGVRRRSPGWWDLKSSTFRASRCLSGRRHGGAFTLRAEVRWDRVRIEVEDAGGPWCDGLRDDGRPRGFDVVAAIAGAGNWGIDGDDRGRVAWARLGR